MIALLLTAAEPATALAAERAFAVDARSAGEAAAVRRWAADGATIFLPRPAHLPAALAAVADAPAIARSPVASLSSCDGLMAAITGSWSQTDGVGRSLTIWRRRDGAWRWDVMGRDRLAMPDAAVAQPAGRQAACAGKPPAQAIVPPDARGVAVGYGRSPDATLQWRYRVEADGARRFVVALWDGAAMVDVIDDQVAGAAAR